MLELSTGSTNQLRTSAGSLDARVMALHLPVALTGRTFGPAWLLAIILHVGLLIAIFLSATVVPELEPPPIRMVFLEPPPPPPAPLGVPDGAGTVPTLIESKPEPVVQRPKDVPKPVVADTSRLTKVEKPKRQAKPKPAEPAPVVAVAPPIAEVAPGVRTGSVGGEAGGVVGGIEGGFVGGVVGGTGTQPIPAGQVANPPQVIHRVTPNYPELARRRGVKGLVLLEAILDREGRVEPAVKILQSIPMLNDEAIAAVRKWRFSPARNRDGAPVRVVLEIPIRFTLRP